MELDSTGKTATERRGLEFCSELKLAQDLKTCCLSVGLDRIQTSNNNTHTEHWPLPEGFNTNNNSGPELTQELFERFATWHTRGLKNAVLDPYRLPRMLHSILAEMSECQ